MGIATLAVVEGVVIVVTEAVAGMAEVVVVEEGMEEGLSRHQPTPQSRAHFDTEIRPVSLRYKEWRGDRIHSERLRCKF